jgi:hypothetical protein
MVIGSPFVNCCPKKFFLIDLIGENESDVVVVDFGVDEKRSFKVDAAETMKSDGQT